MSNPVINPAMLLSPVETGYVAYDPRIDRLHHLNPMAALLAELCDGSRSIADIRSLVGPLIPGGKSEEIDRWFEDALKAGLIVPKDSDSAYREFTAEELYALTKRLKENGQVQTAYLCGKQVVALKPDDWDAWYDLGDMCQSVGRREEARQAYQKWFDAHPDDAEIEHLLVALRDGPAPPRASDRTIQQIYKDFAWSYEDRMLKDLEYKGPQRIEEAIKASLGDRKDLRILDIGCGSGLAGVTLKPYSASMVGIDLSPEMIDLARPRNIYDRLEVAEILTWLAETKDAFDLVVACDCLIYFGDLNAVTAAAKKRLVPGGAFVFSMELGDQFPFRLTDTGRYAHHPDHVREVAAASGMALARLDQNFLRMEYGSPVTGLFAVLVNAPPA